MCGRIAAHLAEMKTHNTGCSRRDFAELLILPFEEEVERHSIWRALHFSPLGSFAVRGRAASV